MPRPYRGRIGGSTDTTNKGILSLADKDFWARFVNPLQPYLSHYLFSSTQPIGFQVGTVGTTSVTLEWQQFGGYAVLVWYEGASPLYPTQSGGQPLIACTDGIQTSITLTGLLPGTLYRFRVAGFNDTGSRGWTGYVYATTLLASARILSESGDALQAENQDYLSLPYQVLSAENSGVILTEAGELIEV